MPPDDYTATKTTTIQQLAGHSTNASPSTRTERFASYGRNKIRSSSSWSASSTRASIAFQRMPVQRLKEFVDFVKGLGYEVTDVENGDCVSSEDVG